jgi:hypothetical protein
MSRALVSTIVSTPNGYKRNVCSEHSENENTDLPAQSTSLGKWKCAGHNFPAERKIEGETGRKEE